MSRSFSSSSGSDGLSQEVDTVDWEFASDETDPSIIVHNSSDMDDDDASIKEEENISMADDAESTIGNLPKTEDLDGTLGHDTDSQGRILFGGILAGPKTEICMTIMIIESVKMIL